MNNDIKGEREENHPKIKEDKNKKNTNFILVVLVAGFIVLAVMASLSNTISIKKHLAYAHHVIDQIPVSNRPMGLSLSDDAKLLYVSNLGKSIVSVINTTTNKPAGDINISSKVGGVMAVEATPQKLYVSPFEGGVVQVYDVSTKNLTKTIQLPNAEIAFKQSPGDRVLLSVSVLTGGWSMTYNHNNQMLYVANYNKDQIVMIDTKTDKVIGTISVPAHPIKVKVDPDNDVLLVTSLAGNGLTFISTKTNQILNTISTGAAPWGLDIDSKEKLAYVANRGTDYVTVVDIPTQRVITKIPIGAPAQSITVDDNEHMIYASYMDQSKIVKINGKTNTIVNTIDMAAGAAAGGGEMIPQDIVSDPDTHTLYVSTKYANSVFVIGPKAISTTLPVITKDIPAALVVGVITAHGQDVQVSEPFVDVRTKNITINVNSPDGGDLTLRIPRSILDAVDKNNGNDIPFNVRIDGNPIQYQEEQKQGAAVGKLDYRAITLFVPKNSKMIDIIGTNTVSIPYA